MWFFQGIRPVAAFRQLDQRSLWFVQGVPSSGSIFLRASGRATFLVATDVAARGLDIPKVAGAAGGLDRCRFGMICWVFQLHLFCGGMPGQVLIISCLLD